MSLRFVALLGFGAIGFQPLQAQTITVSPQPLMSIGRVDGEAAYLLNQVSHVRRLGDGRILVAMGPEIRFYGPDGTHIGNAGGRGSGPGEFQYIQDLVVLPGDTLLVLHFGNRVWLTPEGRYIRQERMDLTPLAAEGWVSEGAVLLPNGNLLAPQYPREIPGDPRMRELHRPTLRYSLFDVSRGVVRPLIVAGGIRQMLVGSSPVVQPFSPHAQHAIGADRVYVGDNDATFLSAYTLTGELIDTIQVADRATPVTASDLDDYREGVLERMRSNPEQARRFEQGWSDVPKPSRLPYWGQAVVDRANNLWVSSYRTPTRSPSWTVFDRSGRRIASLELPAGFVPKEVGNDYVIGVTRDQLGVEYVRMYRVMRQ